MEKNREEIIKGISQVLTTQYDYPPNGMGSLGYKGNNLYRFKVEDTDVINGYIEKRDFTHSYNYEVLAAASGQYSALSFSRRQPLYTFL